VTDLPNLAWLDWAMLATVAASVLVGLGRGLVFELMSLVGWAVAYLAAQVYSAQVGAYVPLGAPGSALHQGAAYAVTFLATLLVWSLLARALRMVIRATPLTLPDRLLGAAFGGLRGVLLLLVVATGVAFTPALRSQAWQDSTGAAWLGQVLAIIKPMLPADVARHLPT
jgi:membrane protein required for colicin V production